MTVIPFFFAAKSPASKDAPGWREKYRNPGWDAPGRDCLTRLTSRKKFPGA